MKLPFVSRSGMRNALFERDIQHSKELCRLGNELSSVRASAHGSEIASAKEVLRLKEQLAQSSSLNASLQREVTMLRAMVSDLQVRDKDLRVEFVEERRKLMDWIAQGIGGGPIFKEIPPAAADEDPGGPQKVATSEQALDAPVPTELQSAIAAVGNKARSIVRHIERQREADFVSEMKKAGVRRIFDEEKAVAEVEAIAITEKA